MQFSTGVWLLAVLPMLWRVALHSGAYGQKQLDSFTHLTFKGGTELERRCEESLERVGEGGGGREYACMHEIL